MLYRAKKSIVIQCRNCNYRRHWAGIVHLFPAISLAGTQTVYDGQSEWCWKEIKSDRENFVSFVLNGMAIMYMYVCM